MEHRYFGKVKQKKDNKQVIRGKNTLEDITNSLVVQCTGCYSMSDEGWVEDTKNKVERKRNRYRDKDINILYRGRESVR